LAQARTSGSAIEWSPPSTIGIRPAPSTSPTVASMAACVRAGVGRQDRCVAVVDDAQLGERVDVGLELRPGRAARGADRPRAEPGSGPVGDEIIRRRADDGDVEAGEEGRILREGCAAVAERSRKIRLFAVLAPAFERVDHRPIVSELPGYETGLPISRTMRLRRHDVYGQRTAA
jgi:hypothetical protein